VQKWIKMVRVEVPKITHGIAREFPDMRLRVAVVGYSDYGCKNPLEIFDFQEYASAGTRNTSRMNGNRSFDDFLEGLLLRCGGENPPPLPKSHMPD